MARTLDPVERIAVTLLAGTIPARPKLQSYVIRIVNDLDFSDFADAWGTEYQPGSLASEMRRSPREFVTVSSDEDATEVQMADHRILRLADAIVIHRQGGSGLPGVSLPMVRLSDIQFDQIADGLGASIVEYTMSLSESAARLAQALEDAR